MRTLAVITLTFAIFVAVKFTAGQPFAWLAVGLIVTIAAILFTWPRGGAR